MVPSGFQYEEKRYYMCAHNTLFLVKIGKIISRLRIFFFFVSQWMHINYHHQYYCNKYQKILWYSPYRPSLACTCIKTTDGLSKINYFSTSRLYGHGANTHRTHQHSCSDKQTDKESSWITMVTLWVNSRNSLTSCSLSYTHTQINWIIRLFNSWYITLRIF